MRNLWQCPECGRRQWAQENITSVPCCCMSLYEAFISRERFTFRSMERIPSWTPQLAVVPWTPEDENE